MKKKRVFTKKFKRRIDDLVSLAPKRRRERARHNIREFAEDTREKFWEDYPRRSRVRKSALARPMGVGEFRLYFTDTCVPKIKITELSKKIKQEIGPSKITGPEAVEKAFQQNVKLFKKLTTRLGQKR